MKMKRICVLLVMMGLAVEASGQTVTGSGCNGFCQGRD